MSSRTPGDRLAPDEIDNIIELKLDSVPVRDICTQLGCAIETVQRHWTAWLDAASEERRTHLERQQTDTMMRLDHIAAEARRGAIRAEDDWAAVARFMNVERRALMDMARIGGLLAPQQVTVGGGFQFPTEEEAKRILAEIDELPPMKKTA